MADLLIMLEERKSDILHALKIKSSLKDRGFSVAGLLLRGSDSSPRFIEDLVKIPINRNET